MANVHDILAVALSGLSVVLSSWSLYWGRRARKAVREIASQPSPVIHMAGTLTPEAEAKLSAKLQQGIERLARREGRQPW